MVTLFASAVPVPTAARVEAGTVVMSLTTLAGRAVPVAESAPAVVVGLCVVLITMKATRITMTPRMPPPVHSIRLRISRLRCAARCAAILSRAFSRLTLVALPITRPMKWCQ